MAKCRILCNSKIPPEKKTYLYYLNTEKNVILRRFDFMSICHCHSYYAIIEFYLVLMICEATSDWYEYISCINYAEKIDFFVRCDDGIKFSQFCDLK